MPFGTIWASGGEPFIVPAKAKNPQGGMEQLRIMLSEESSQELHQQVKSLTALQRRHRRPDPAAGPAVRGRRRWRRPGDNVVNPRLQDWYVKLQKEQHRRRRCSAR